MNDFDEKDLMKDIDALGKAPEEKPAEKEEPEEASAPVKAGAKAKKVFTRAQVILITVIAALAVILVGTIVICSVANINPVSYIAGEATKEKLVNKWQSQDAPGISAYEFYEDGTYSSYFLSYSFDGSYEVEGNKLTLKNPNSNQNVVYNYSITGNTLTLTLADVNGKALKGSEPSKFDRVDTLNQKSLQEAIDSYKAQKADEDASQQAAE